MQSFIVVRFNQRTYVSGGVVCVVRNQGAALQISKDLMTDQEERDRMSGWRFFVEASDLTPGMNADEATRVRQLRFDRQDAAA